MSNGHFAERTFCQTDNLPKIAIFYRENRDIYTNKVSVIEVFDKSHC
jgi:hypothetical protein